MIGSHDLSVNAGQPEVTPLVFEGQPFMVDPQQVQNGGMEIMHVNAVLGDAVGVVVRLSVSQSAFYVAPRRTKWRNFGGDDRAQSSSC